MLRSMYLCIFIALTLGLGAWGGLTTRNAKIAVPTQPTDACEGALRGAPTTPAPRTRGMKTLQPRSFVADLSHADPAGHTVIYNEKTGRLEPVLVARSRGFAPIARGTTRGISVDPLFEKTQELGLTLEDCGKDDLPKLKAFIHASRSEFAESTPELDEDLVDIDASYKLNKGHLLMIKNGAEIVGSGAIYNLGDGQAEVRKLYLHPSIRSRKLGKPLFQHLLTWAANQGYRVIELETYASMTAARGMYEAFGFTQFFPRRILKENETISDPAKKVMGYLLFLNTRVAPGEQTEVQRAYQKMYQEKFDEEFIKELRENPKYGEKVFASLLEAAMGNPRAEYAVYEMLGILRNKDGSIRFPSHHEIVERLLGLYSDLDLDPKYWLLPALTFKRDLGNGRAEYRTITPGRHPFPTEPGFEIIDRVPDPIFRQMVVNGFLPLSNLHDIHHFIVMVAYPEFMHSIALAEQGHRQTGQLPNPLFTRRINYALESLVLADPSKKNEIMAALKVPRLNPKGFGSFADYFGKVDVTEMTAHASQLAKDYIRYLRFYSGAGISPIERAIEENTLREKYKDDSAMEEFIETFDVARPYDANLDLPRDSFQEDPTFWSIGLSFVLKYRETLLVSHAEQARIGKVDKVLRKMLARMEYFLWASATEVTQDRWVKDMVHIDSPVRSRTLNFIRESFGENAITSRMLLSR